MSLIFFFILVHPNWNHHLNHIDHSQRWWLQKPHRKSRQSLRRMHGLVPLWYIIIQLISIVLKLNSFFPAFCLQIHPTNGDDKPTDDPSQNNQKTSSQKNAEWKVNENHTQIDEKLTFITRIFKSHSNESWPYVKNAFSKRNYRFYISNVFKI